jgi:hypothetical protein
LASTDLFVKTNPSRHLFGTDRKEHLGRMGRGITPCAECFEGFRPTLYGDRIDRFHRLALGFRAQPRV